jgi:hypothetical protein
MDYASRMKAIMWISLFGLFACGGSSTPANGGECNFGCDAGPACTCTVPGQTCTIAPTATQVVGSECQCDPKGSGRWTCIAG